MGKASTEMRWTEPKQPDHKEMYVFWQDAMLCFEDKENKQGKVERQMALIGRSLNHAVSSERQRKAFMGF